MSFFDIVGAIAWALSTAPTPVENENGDPTYVYGAVGTKASCTAQGFLFQLNFTSIFYNISLSSYYLLGTLIFLNSGGGYSSDSMIFELLSTFKISPCFHCCLYSYCVWMARPKVKTKSMVASWCTHHNWSWIGFCRDTILPEYHLWVRGSRYM
jgi:hypothetical protein